MVHLIPLSRSRELSSIPNSVWIDRFFDDVGSLFRTDGSEWRPSFDISDTDTHVHIKADLPGIDVKDLEVVIENNVLTVRGEKKREKEDNGESYHFVERSYGSFCRTFNLPCEVKADEIEAVYKDGVLELTVPKSETGKRRKIEVKH